MSNIHNLLPSRSLLPSDAIVIRQNMGWIRGYTAGSVLATVGAVALFVLSHIGFVLPAVGCGVGIGLLLLSLVLVVKAFVSSEKGREKEARLLPVLLIAAQAYHKLNLSTVNSSPCNLSEEERYELLRDSMSQTKNEASQELQTSLDWDAVCNDGAHKMRRRIQKMAGKASYESIENTQLPYCYDLLVKFGNVPITLTKEQWVMKMTGLTIGKKTSLFDPSPHIESLRIEEEPDVVE